MSRKTTSPERKAPAAAAPATAFARAMESFGAARFDEAKAFLEFARPTGVAERGAAELLRARIARHLEDFETSFEEATSAARHLTSPGEKLVATALAGSAARSLEREDVADKLFANVRDGIRGEHGANVAPAAYLLAVDAWQRHDVDDAEAIVAPFLKAGKTDANLVALLGWIAIRRERHRDAGTHFNAALAALEAVSQPDDYMKASFIHGLANVAAETADVRLGRRARRAFDELTWTEPLTSLKFDTLLNLRHLSLLEGDLDQAWLDARELTATAPTTASAVTAEVLAAAGSRMIGDAHASTLLLNKAWAQIRAEKWGAATDEERVGLITFAFEAARDMPAEARQALTMYRSLRAKRQRASSLDEDRRVDAFTAFAVGRIDEAMGERYRAVERYREALEIYESLGLNYRIALVASDLFRLTRSDDYKAQVDDALKRAPNAWLRAEPNPADDLGPKAREILARLLVGESAKTVAAELGRSTFTVSNHTRRIFAVFGVHSRDALREECARLGITPVTLRR